MAARDQAGLQPILISTGQHREMVQDVLDLFNCRLDADLDVMQPNQSLAILTSKISERLDRYIQSEVDAVIVQGDTTSAMVAAMLAFYKKVPCAHVEAGLRSHDMMSPFPEEYNRRIISLSARWHFAPTTTARENLRREGVTANVHVVGNTAIDAAYMIAERRPGPSREILEAFPVLGEPSRRTILVTAHRRENFGEPLQQIIGAIAEVAAIYPDVDIIWPVHPNPNVRDIVYRLVPAMANIFLTKPLRYDDLLYLIRKSFLILTDSGGIQEEAPAFKVPVIVLRTTTERPEGVKNGCSVLAGPTKEGILHHVSELLSSPRAYQRMIEAKNPYGDGKSSQRIVETIAAAIN